MLFRSKKTIINDKKKRYNELKSMKIQIDKIAEKNYNIHKAILALLFISLFITAFVFIYYVDWNQFEKYSYFLGFIPVLIFVLYFVA